MISAALGGQGAGSQSRAGVGGHQASPRRVLALLSVRTWL